MKRYADVHKLSVLISDEMFDFDEGSVVVHASKFSSFISHIDVNNSSLEHWFSYIHSGLSGSAFRRKRL